MPCDRKLKPKQSISERAEEIRTVVARIASGLATGRYKAVVGPQGAIAFSGLTEAERDGVNDACAYRRLLSSGSPMALQAIARAEALAGRPVDKQMIGQGAHSHDGGRTFHTHKG